MNDINLKKLGKLLKECRLNKKMTLREVSEHLGVTHKSVQFWEQGTNEIKLSTFIELCSLYGVSPNSILEKLLK